MLRRSVVIVPLAVAVLVAAGCGGKKENPTTAWANSLCTSISTWQDSLTSAVNSFKGGNLSKASFQKAVNDVGDATDKLQSDVKKLGKPPTESGDKAQQAIDDLSTEVRAGLDQVKKAANNANSLSDVLAAVSSATGALSTLSSQVQATYNELQQLDPKGELQKGFNDAQACKDLRKRNTSTNG